MIREVFKNYDPIGENLNGDDYSRDSDKDRLLLLT